MDVNITLLLPQKAFFRITSQTGGLLTVIEWLVQSVGKIIHYVSPTCCDRQDDGWLLVGVGYCIALPGDTDSRSQAVADPLISAPQVELPRRASQWDLWALHFSPSWWLALWAYPSLARTARYHTRILKYQCPWRRLLT
jgi:hypothetical protein